MIIAGEPPTSLTTFGAGAGPVNIYNNLIEANLANDDGGGLRFLTAGNFPYNVYNNMIVNNISTHEGGGVAIDNAPNVRFFNNTVMKNLTTATAATSNGLPAPAGLSTALNNDFLQPAPAGRLAALQQPAPVQQHLLGQPGGHLGRRATSSASAAWSGQNGVQVPDPTPINHWDMGVPGTLQPAGADQLASSSPRRSRSPTTSCASPTNKCRPGSARSPPRTTRRSWACRGAATRTSWPT